MACTKKKTEITWSESFYIIGSQSSPRVADLNNDGVLDIIMGAGKGETVATDEGVLAIDGLTGKSLWKQKAPAHVVGSPSFQDINNDGAEDVFIGGRGCFLGAFDGKTGDELWRFNPEFANDSILRYAKFNFYNGVWIPDQNSDGIDELLTVNGGNWSARAGSAKGRLPGVLMLFDSKSGEVIAADTMPDAQESYMSPVSYVDPQSNTRKIVFGTGGETLSGSLFVATLEDLMHQNLSNAEKLVSENEHGFIAPPALADLNEDGTLDIIAISHASTVHAIDGANHQVLWTKRFPGTESSNGLAIGHFTSKDQLEIMAVMNRGTWPKYTYAHQVILNGSSGAINFHDSVGCFAVSAPVVYDLDRDGRDEAVMNINSYNCETDLEGEFINPNKITHQLVALDFETGEYQVIDQTLRFRNIFSTPWLGDLDADGYLDIVYTSYNHADDLKIFLGMSIKRISTHVKVKQPVIWGGYMGSNGDGIYQ